MESTILHTRVLGTLEPGTLFSYPKGKAIYEVYKKSLMALEYTHIETGEVFKVAATRMVKTKSNAYFAKVCVLEVNQ